MQHVEKKKPRTPLQRERLWLLLVCAMALAGVILLTWHMTRPEPVTPSLTVNQPVPVFAHPSSDVTALTIHRSGEQPWTLVLDESTGCFRLTGEDGFLLSPVTTLELQQAAAVITCEQVISDDPAEYAALLPEFGLEPPDCTAIITFRDGTVRTLHTGSRTAHAPGCYYMRLEGDDRLFALSSGMVEALFVSQESLRDVSQPTIHKARIDRLTLRSGDGSIRAQWTLTCDVTASDAAERWLITAPFTYSADSQAMQNLLANAANLRLGAYVAPATPANLSLYGFDAPRQTIEIHMAAAAMGTTGFDGAYAVTDWPENTVTFTIGGARSDMVDYVLCGDAIYVSSHFTMGMFVTIDPAATMNRYPVLTALGNLASLTVEENGQTTTYTLTRTEQVAPNNDLVYDEEGNLVWDVTVLRDGEPFSYDAFAAAYTRLSAISVAGSIPEGDTVDAAPHTIYTFTDVDGTVHTVALSSYGVLHDAVTVDGHQAFYIAKGIFRLQTE